MVDIICAVDSTGLGFRPIPMPKFISNISDFHRFVDFILHTFLIENTNLAMVSPPNKRVKNNRLNIKKTNDHQLESIQIVLCPYR